MNNVGTLNGYNSLFDDEFRHQMKVISDSQKAFSDNLSQSLKAMMTIPKMTFADDLSRSLKAMMAIPKMTFADDLSRSLKAMMAIPKMTFTDDLSRSLKAIMAIPNIAFTDSFKQQLLTLADSAYIAGENNKVEKFLEGSSEFNNQYFTNYSDTAVDNISDDELNEINNDLISIAEDKLNWQQKVAKTISKWEERNPVVAFILNKIIMVIVLGLITSAIFLAITKTESKVKAEPKYNSQIIYNIEEQEEVTVINEVPYYYEVEFADIKDKKTKTGWVSKRSLHIISEEQQLDETKI